MSETTINYDNLDVDEQDVRGLLSRWWRYKYSVEWTEKFVSGHVLSGITEDVIWKDVDGKDIKANYTDEGFVLEILDA